MNSVQNSLEQPEIKTIKPAVAMQLKSVALESFLALSDAPESDQTHIEQNAHIYDLITGVTDEDNLYQVYQAETGTELMLSSEYQGIASARFKRMLVAEYSRLEARFLQLMRLQLQDMYTTLN